jgi:hypothetical protein
MKTNSRLLNHALKLLWLVCLLAASSLAYAQPSAHYPPGVEGIKAASLPPPGVYARDYNYFYIAHQVNNGSGDSAGPPDFDVFTYGNIPRVIWITDTKVLGGFVGVDALIPLLYQNVTAGGGHSENFGAGDVACEATLSWHTKQFDFAVGSGFWAPSGASGSRGDAGLGYWTFMQTAGATWYVDEEKTWAVSALNRYEFNTDSRNTHITTGQAWTLEWGISKTLEKVYDVGLVGYYQMQTTGSYETGVDVPSGINRVGAIGPEISVAFPKPMIFVSARYNYEFMAQNRAQGSTVCLTITKRF